MPDSELRMVQPCPFYSGRNITYPATHQHSKLLAERALGSWPSTAEWCLCSWACITFWKLSVISVSLPLKSSQWIQEVLVTKAHKLQHFCTFRFPHANASLSLLVVFDFSFLRFPPPQGHHTLTSQWSVDVEDLCSIVTLLYDLRQMSVLQFPLPECGDDNRTYSWGYYEN